MSTCRRFYCLLLAAFLMHFHLPANAEWSPPQVFSSFPHALNPNITADNSGNAAAGWISDISGVYSIQATLFNNNAWETTQQLGPTSSEFYNLLSATYNTNNFLVTWLEVTGLASALQTYYYNGTSWGQITSPPNSSMSQIAALAATGSGQAMIGWSTGTSNPFTINGAVFDGTSWVSVNNSIAMGSQGPIDVAINSSGNGVIAWMDLTNIIHANLFSGGAFGGVSFTDGSMSFAGSIVAQIDENGNIMLAYPSSGNVQIAFYNGSTWSTAQTFTLVNNPVGTIDLSMNASGDAALVFADNSNNVFAANYVNGIWSTATQIYTAPGALDNSTAPTVKIDTSGNAYAFWTASFSPSLQALSSFYQNGSWQASPTVVSSGTSGTAPYATPDTTIFNIGPGSLALDEDLHLYAIWQAYDSDNDDGIPIASIFSAQPEAPTNLFGRVLNNRFLTQTDRIYKLEWTPANDPTITAYLLRRNGQLIYTAPATGPYKYEDHNRNKKVPDTYQLTSQNQNGVESTPLTFTFD